MYSVLNEEDRKLLDKFFAGNIRALSRIVSAVEDGGERGRAFLKELYPKSGNSYIIGITGAPGVGKSTLTERLVSGYRGEGKTVGVIAIDPTSPFSGGAILGDRIRMQKHFTDPGVFIRSSATRGKMGGLSAATGDMAVLLDAFGFDYIIIETVGVGQDEVEVIDTAFTSLVVLVPGLGDDIQHIKAGIMEVANIFVINKADRPGVERTEREVKMMLELSSADKGPIPPVLRTVARTGEGVTELISEIARHRDYLENNNLMERVMTDRSRKLLLAAAGDVATMAFTDYLEKNGAVEEGTKEIKRRKVDARTVAENFFRKFLKEGIVD